MPRSERSERSERSSRSGVYRPMPGKHRRGRDKDSDVSSRTSGGMMVEERIFDRASDVGSDERTGSSGFITQLNSQRSRRSAKSAKSDKSKVSFHSSEFDTEGSQRTTFLSQAIASKQEASSSELGSNRPDRATRVQDLGSYNRQGSRRGSGSTRPSSRQQWSPRSVGPEGQSQWEVGSIYPVLPGRLYFCVSERNMQAKFSDEYFFFKSELAAEYRSYYKDFGPTKLSVVFRFCNLLHKMMSAKRYKDKKLVLQMQEMPEIRTNAAFLMASYLTLRQDMTPEDACAPFTGFDVEPFMQYRDATFLHPDFTISILDCVKGLKKASDRGWFKLDSFDVDEYEYYENPENGCLNQMCEKFIAFSGPVEGGSTQDFALPPEAYIEPFLRNNVTAVIRLNEPMYSTDVFAKAGIKHYDLFFRDSTTPHEGICERFFQICTQEEGRVAVHCKTGQGRTGTLIALWYMHQHGFKAKEAIAWVRLVRPGSVIGPQQDFLKAKEGKKAPSRRTSVVIAQNIQAPLTFKEKMLRWLPFGGCRQKLPHDDNRITKQFSEAAKLRQKALDHLGEAKFPSTQSFRNLSGSMSDLSNTPKERSSTPPVYRHRHSTNLAER